jgi:anti-anti-sigma factor
MPRGYETNRDSATGVFEIAPGRNPEDVEARDLGFSVITLTGEADAFVAPRIRSDLAAALGGESPLVVDLSGTTFLDSTVVGVLLEGLADCERRERPLFLLLPDDAAPEVHRLFEITGLAAFLPVVRSWDEASLRIAQ